ncbi:NADH pyrophosphatase, partial [Podila epigama]
PTNNGSYSTISGTSMASPHVAGALALAVEQWRLLTRSTKPLTGSQIQRIYNTFKNTATPTFVHNETIDANEVASPLDPNPGLHNNTRGTVASIAKQGAGLINVFRGLKGLQSFLSKSTESIPSLQTFVSPPSIELNDTEFATAKPVMLTVSNNGPVPIVYRLGHVPAEALHEPSIEAREIRLREIAAGTYNTSQTKKEKEDVVFMRGDAQVYFGDSTFTVPANSHRRIKVKITAPKNLPADQHWIYSGYITITPVDTAAAIAVSLLQEDAREETSTSLLEQSVHVPYAGVTGRMKELPIFLWPTEEEVAEASEKALCQVLASSVANKTEVVYSMVDDDFPLVSFCLMNPSRYMVMDLIGPVPEGEGNVNSNGDVGDVQVIGRAGSNEFVARSPASSIVTTVQWKGVVESATPPSQLFDKTAVPDQGIRRAPGMDLIYGMRATPVPGDGRETGSFWQHGKDTSLDRSSSRSSNSRESVSDSPGHAAALMQRRRVASSLTENGSEVLPQDRSSLPEVSSTAQSVPRRRLQILTRATTSTAATGVRFIQPKLFSRLIGTKIHSTSLAPSTTSTSLYLTTSLNMANNSSNNNNNSSGIDIFEAAAAGNLDSIKSFDRVQLEAKNDRGWTPLMFAARFGHASVLEYLLSEAKVDPNIVNKDGKTATDLAELWGAAEATAVLDQLAPSLSKKKASMATTNESTPSSGIAEWWKKRTVHEIKPLHFSGSIINRLSFLREDKEYLQESVQAPSTRFILLQDHGVLFKSSTKHLAFASYDDVKGLIGPDPLNNLPEGLVLVFLGADEVSAPEPGDSHQEILVKGRRGIGYWALDMTAKGPLVTPELKAAVQQFVNAFPEKHGHYFAEMRPAAFGLSKAESGLLAQARSVVDWNRRNQFCTGCGRKSLSLEGGHKRTCPPVLNEKGEETLSECLAHKGVQNFTYPRTDPVVITCVISRDGERVLLGRQATWPKGTYSCLAGFVEPGESLEEAARREVKEESGVLVGHVMYHSSQPWPFPNTLMIGCHAEAIQEDIHLGLEDKELEDARWFTRQEILDALKGSRGTTFGQPVEPGVLRLPPGTAIAHVILRAWATGEGEIPQPRM